MKLTQHQQEALSQIRHFLTEQTNQLFVLRGYAGTGKTTLIGKLVDWLEEQERPARLLATTGRAAKVLQNKTGRTVGTVHGCIYAFDEVSGEAEEGQQLELNFSLRSNQMVDTDLVFIIDEASMISHEKPRGDRQTARFGSGSLLNDLLDFADGRQIIFVGDPCQLPPVADNPLSSALSLEFLAELAGSPPHTFELKEIIRQNRGSEILQLAGRFRESVVLQRYEKWPKVAFPQGLQASVLDDHFKLQETYIRHLKKEGFQSSILIGFSNWQINMLNRKVREALYPNWELQPNELLMVVQNSYNVNLANGDQVILEKATYDSKRAGFTFLNVKVRALHNDEVYETLLIRELLYNDQPGLGRDEVQQLMIDFDQRMRKKGLKRKMNAYREAMMTDPYLNALRAKFGYAITCHKAQGGEWPQVYLNIHKSVYGMQSEQLHRWFYTALTRAKDHLYMNDGWWIERFNQRRPDAAAKMYAARNRKKS